MLVDGQPRLLARLDGARGLPPASSDEPSRSTCPGSGKLRYRAASAPKPAPTERSSPRRSSGSASRRSHLVLHDFGGPFGMAWGLEHPRAWRSVVLMNIGVMPGYQWHSLAKRWRSARRRLSSLQRVDPALGAGGARWRRANPKGLPLGVRRQDVRRLRPRRRAGRSSRSTERRPIPGQAAAELGPALAALHKPALVGVGRQGPLRLQPTTPSASASSSTCAGSRCCPESGHWPFQDDPQAVAAAVLPFLREQLGAAAPGSPSSAEEVFLERAQAAPRAAGASTVVMKRARPSTRTTGSRESLLRARSAAAAAASATAEAGLLGASAPAASVRPRQSSSGCIPASPIAVGLAVPPARPNVSAISTAGAGLPRAMPASSCRRARIARRPGVGVAREQHDALRRGRVGDVYARVGADQPVPRAADQHAAGGAYDLRGLVEHDLDEPRVLVVLGRQRERALPGLDVAQRDDRALGLGDDRVSDHDQLLAARTSGPSAASRARRCPRPHAPPGCHRGCAR